MVDGHCNLFRPLTESFDWFSGTSTGGMVAVALCMGLSISKVRIPVLCTQ